MAELNFEKLFKIQMTVLKILRCHPDTKVDKYWVLQNFILFGIYFTNFCFLLYATIHYSKIEDYFNAFRNVVPLTFSVCTTTYYFILVKNRSIIGKLVKSMKDDYTKACAIDNRQRKIIIEQAEKGRKLMWMWFLLTITIVLVFIGKSIILTVYHTQKNGGLKLIPFYEMDYPFNLAGKREKNKFLYTIMYIYETNFTAFSTMLYFCTVPLGPICILHACGQIELIILKFENLFYNDDLEEILTDIVRYLQHIYSFVKNINGSYTLIYEILLKHNMILLPLSSYSLIQSIKQGQLTIEYAAVFLQALVNTSVICSYGDMLMQKGDEVRKAAYNCGWECVDLPKARKILLIIMTRTSKSIAIETIFTTICLDTLTNIYRQAYTIFNLMTAMW